MFNSDHFFRLMISAYRKHSAYFSIIWHDLAQFSTANNLFKVSSHIFFSNSNVPACFGTSRLVLARLNMSQRDSRCFNKIQHVSTITQKEHAPNQKHQYIVSSSSIFYLANLLVRV